MVEWSNGRMDEWTNGRMDEWTNGRMDERTISGIEDEYGRCLEEGGVLLSPLR